MSVLKVCDERNWLLHKGTTLAAIETGTQCGIVIFIWYSSI